MKLCAIHRLPWVVLGLLPALLPAGAVTADPADSQAEIRALLVRGATYLRRMQLTEPEGENATAMFLEVLDRDPGNPAARAGLREVVDQSLRLAAAERTAGATDRALEWIDAALSAIPNNPRLLAAREELVASPPADQGSPVPTRQQRIDTLLAEADQHFKDMRLTRPTGRNAFAALAKVLQIDPDNPEAKAGLERITDRYYRLAAVRRDRGELRKSLAYIETGLKVIPDHPKLLALRDDVKARLADLTTGPGREEEPPVEVTALLARARGQLQAGRTVHPPGDNALETYRSILEKDADNSAARTGIDRLLVAAQQDLLQRLDRLQTVERALDREEASLRARAHNTLVTAWRRRQEENAGP